VGLTVPLLHFLLKHISRIAGSIREATAFIRKISDASPAFHLRIPSKQPDRLKESEIFVEIYLEYPSEEKLIRMSR
jgi:hypothetical protein